MNKPELVAALADKSGASKTQVEAVLDGLTEVIVKDVLKNGNSIGLPGLGTFKQKKSAARNGRNPSTGAAIKIKASTKIGFSMSSTLKK